MNVVRLAGTNGEGEILNFTAKSMHSVTIPGTVSAIASASSSSITFPFASASATATPTHTPSVTAIAFSHRGSLNLSGTDDDVAMMEGGTSVDSLILQSKLTIDCLIKSVCVCVCVCFVCVFVYVCVHVCMYVCMYVHMYAGMYACIGRLFIIYLHPVIFSSILTFQMMHQTTAQRCYLAKKNKR